MIDPTAVIGHAPESREYWANPDMPTFQPSIHHSAKLHCYVTVDAGMTRQTSVGENTWLGHKVHVGHDAVIGRNCEIAPGVVICGHVEIGDGVRIGVNACIRPFIKVGALARIGCGAVVIRDVPPGQVVAGNPAKPIVAQGQYVPPPESVREGWDLLAEAAGRPSEVYR